MSANTLFLRLEGPMQAWGSHESKFVIRRVMDAPTKSGVIGLLLCALGVSREAARNEGWLTRLSALRMGVRMDRAGMRWWDYHTVGAGMKMRIASGGSKDGPILTRREYLCDASYLVALQGDTDFIAQLQDALVKPVWTLYLGRKCCVPSMPVFSEKVLPCSSHNTPLDALKSIPLFPRNDKEPQPEQVTCFLDWIPQREHDVAPADAQIWYDVPVSLDPPAHEPRFVIKQTLSVGENGGLTVSTAQIRKGAQSPPRPRADYRNSEYRAMRTARLDQDKHLCVFCKSFGTTVQHITYKHAGGQEKIEELRTLCRLCHDAVTMIEYGAGMGLDRINPEEPQWREQILETRNAIIANRSLETRRRRLEHEEVE
jgi:CRISPR system Cascade subunit CasD